MDLKSEILARAEAHYAAGRLDRAAETAWVYFRDIEPKNPASHALLGRIAADRGRIRAAVEHAGKALEIDPHDPVLRAQLTAALERLAADGDDDPRLARGAAELLRRMAGPDQPPAEPPPTGDGVDIVLPMTMPAGSERNAIATAAVLRRHGVDVTLWSTVTPHPTLSRIDPDIRVIGADGLPDFSILFIAGIYFQPIDWMRAIRPRRVLLHFNVFQIVHLPLWLGAATTAWPEAAIEIVYPSSRVRDIVGVPGLVKISPIDLDRFSCRPVDRIETIGRLSRPTLRKHHPDDPALYVELLQRGLAVRIMGGAELAPLMPPHERLTLLPAFAIPAEALFAGIDLFLYRTGTGNETGGRVVAEAMACGLPVLCHPSGGYAELIRHGENGFFFNTNGEALAVIDRLRREPGLARRVGAAARRTVEGVFSGPNVDALVTAFIGRPA